MHLDKDIWVIFVCFRNCASFSKQVNGQNWEGQYWAFLLVTAGILCSFEKFLLVVLVVRTLAQSILTS